MRMHPIAACFINSWVLTQTVSVQQQVMRGVRTFDVRIAYDSVHRDFFVSHNYLTHMSIANALVILQRLPPLYSYRLVLTTDWDHRNVTVPSEDAERLTTLLRDFQQSSPQNQWQIDREVITTDSLWFDGHRSVRDQKHYTSLVESRLQNMPTTTTDHPIYVNTFCSPILREIIPGYLLAAIPAIVLAIAVVIGLLLLRRRILKYHNWSSIRVSREDWVVATTVLLMVLLFGSVLVYLPTVRHRWPLGTHHVIQFHPVPSLYHVGKRPVIWMVDHV